MVHMEPRVVGADIDTRHPELPNFGARREDLLIVGDDPDADALPMRPK